MKKVIVIVGPTGVGKTKLSIELAKKLKTEIINADSTQVYKGLNIGTAKITNKEKEGIQHHLIDIVDICDTYSVYQFQKDAREKIKEITSKNMIPIIVGGTGLYLKAALYDYHFEKEDKNNKMELYEDLDDLQLHNVLKNLNEEKANQIHPNNRKRVLRTIHILKNSKFQQKPAIPLYDIEFIGLTTNRETLYENINKRTKKMFEDGLLEEVSELYKSYKNDNYYSLQAISYKELFSYLSGEITLEETIELIQKTTRNYAKRQYTWFNNQFSVRWFDVDFLDFENTVSEVVKHLNRKQ